MSDHYTIDVYSPTWAVMKKTLLAELEDTRARNDVPGTDTATTEFLRGRISLALELLDLGEPNSG